ncbi:helicase C-terminal domain-containing protein [Spinellus fusiger]|nr:helicase C-terminal domain-containing protein [Spinellus fusiger]
MPESPKTPSLFGFPYNAYSIQNDFMRSLYSTLSESKIGIFESPTGTGKSLSLICGSMSWLNDHDIATSITTKDNPPSELPDDEPDWVKAYQGDQSKNKKELLKKELKLKIQSRIELIRKHENGNSILQSLSRIDRPAWKREKKNEVSSDNDGFLLNEYISDNDGDGDDKSKTINYSNADDADADADDEFDEVKIYYTSRTHSQLSQFVYEVNKTQYANNLWSVPLGSRKNLCINKNVRKYSNMNRINEACQDLQKKNTEKKRCPYLPTMNEKERWHDFRDHTLARVRDIEDIVKIGESLSVCPYYGSRQVAKPARLIVLPYQHILHASTRESLGISLKGNIVIVDEAHNLIETISSIHTVSLTLYQSRTALSQLGMYMARYKERLLGKNIGYIKQIAVIIKALIQILNHSAKEKKDQILGVNEFLHMLSIDHFNMFKLEKYLKESDLARKLNGFIEMEQQKKEKEDKKQLSRQHQKGKIENEQPKPPATMPNLTQVQTFIMTLTNPDKDGRVFISWGGSDKSEPHLKYMLLNPAEVFRPIVEECRSIILAGGTMEPISDFTKHLFPDIPDSHINKFSCGHIIPFQNLLTLNIDEGPSGKSLLFNYENRQDNGLIDEVGKIIVNLCNVIPDGVVCFFSSFSYLETVFKRWSSTDGGHILERLAKKKKIFKEPRESNMVDATLRDYSLHIDSIKVTSNTGAILFCVVNGKMSEGINFSDKLGRGVIMVGLPFANRGSIELNEKIKYANEHGVNIMGTSAGNEYYENLCMRGVNQSIGRAIRHKDDYSTIVLLDKRYSTAKIQGKLPSWIGDHSEHCEKFGKAVGKVGSFFRQHRRA